jgi:flagellar hook-associated protein 3 FlgL
MRVTEARLLELSAAHLASARESLAKPIRELSSGARVDRPSVDPVAWAAGKRAEARLRITEGRGHALARSRDHLAEVDRALGVIGDVMARARELAILAGSDTYSADDRATVALELESLRNSAVGAANTRAPDGEYVLAGGSGDQPPFLADGSYVGDAGQREIELADGVSVHSTIPGSRLTGTAIDVFAALNGLATALAANGADAIRSAVDDLDVSTRQVNRTRSEAGGLDAMLQRAEDARRDSEQALMDFVSRTVGSDSIDATQRLAAGANAMETAQRLGQRIADLLRS